MTSTSLILFSAIGWGDPHYIDVTRHKFDYHGEGEFLLIEIGPECSQLQGVLSKLGRSRRGVAVHTSFAFGEPERFAYQVSLVLRYSIPTLCIILHNHNFLPNTMPRNYTFCTLLV